MLAIMMVQSTWPPTNAFVSEDNAFNQSDLFCDKYHVKLLAQTFLPTFFWCVFFVGTIGNAFVILVYWRYKGKKNLTDRYLIHLAIADLLFLFTLPFWAIAAQKGWSFNTLMCKIVNSMYKINLYSCMLFLMFISFDRYTVVVRPMRAQYSKQKRLMYHKFICFGVWLMAVLLCIPEIIYSQTELSSNITVCRMIYPPSVNRSIKVTDLSLKIVIGFLLPFLVIVVCYTCVAHTIIRAKRTPKHKPFKIITIIILVFLFSQVPYNSVLLVKTMVLYAPAIKDCKMLDHLDLGFQLTQSIAFLHSCLNPFLYVFAGQKFRKTLFQMLKSVTQGHVKMPEQCTDSQGYGSQWSSSALFGESKIKNSFTMTPS
ncbi:C-C chemokine receptor type 9 [Sceloporus undulatus]|uniref:C-C chemokine receptor type 9 n=1 Tax=Sceloporus undulatus TaxID=8520 RepID=UPI001C4B0717|nr:C-C chemokine receptor type 9 [Sceloporus undulatus]XP_042327551.1 C-C chemokine receptor type 9 [Sceloporus undulatus]